MFQDYLQVCSSCKGAGVEPDFSQRIELEKFMFDSNIFDQSFEEVLRQFWFDVNAIDIGWLYISKEYIEDGFYLTKQSRQGIFRASDSDGDGFVTEAEYVINRMITDEAKEIFHKLDTNKDNKLSAKEIIASGKFKDEKLAQAVFKALDVDGNKSLIIPEYLRVWGRWARAD